VKMSTLIGKMLTFFDVAQVLICPEESESFDILAKDVPLKTFSNHPLIGRSLAVNCSQHLRDYPGHDVVWLELGPVEDLPLRFDTMLVSISDTSEDVWLLQEHYGMKGMHFTSLLGEFDSKSGELDVPEPNIWMRRKDLRGVKLSNALLPWDPMVLIGKFHDVTNEAMVILQKMMKQVAT